MPDVGPRSTRSASPGIPTAKSPAWQVCTARRWASTSPRVPVRIGRIRPDPSGVSQCPATVRWSWAIAKPRPHEFWIFLSDFRSRRRWDYGISKRWVPVQTAVCVRHGRGSRREPLAGSQKASGDLSCSSGGLSAVSTAVAGGVLKLHDAHRRKRAEVWPSTVNKEPAFRAAPAAMGTSRGDCLACLSNCCITAGIRCPHDPKKSPPRFFPFEAHASPSPVARSAGAAPNVGARFRTAEGPQRAWE